MLAVLLSVPLLAFAKASRINLQCGRGNLPGFGFVTGGAGFLILPKQSMEVGLAAGTAPNTTLLQPRLGLFDIRV
jgi:hypothetical protein